jgi:hypothetical protein
MENKLAILRTKVLAHAKALREQTRVSNLRTQAELELERSATELRAAAHEVQREAMAEANKDLGSVPAPGA